MRENGSPKIFKVLSKKGNMICQKCFVKKVELNLNLKNFITVFKFFPIKAIGGGGKMKVL